MPNINNRSVDKQDLTFFQWLNYDKGITKREFRELPEYKQENYRTEYELFKKAVLIKRKTYI